MSWMDSWSRPTKVHTFLTQKADVGIPGAVDSVADQDFWQHAATPPPLYLAPGGEAVPYCHTCGRVVSTRKSQTSKAASTPVKFCSDRCRHNKPSQAPGSTDRRIQDAFIALLNGQNLPPEVAQDPFASSELPLSKAAKGHSKKVKGETRITVSCAEVEALIFGARHDPEKAFGRRKNRAPRGVPEPKEWRSVDMENKDDELANSHPNAPDTADDDHCATSSDTSANDHHADMISLRVRSPQSHSDVNGSIGGEKGWAEKIIESPEMLQKRLEGQKRAEERESVRCAARRLCAFGVGGDGDKNGKGAKGKGKGKGKGRENGGDVIAADGVGDDDDGCKDLKRKCEAVMSGSVVEASFAKGDWGVRWRE